MRTTPRLLNLDRMQLSPDEALIELSPTGPSEALTFWDYCSLAGLECYTEDQLPEHRRIHWNKHLSPA
ncbi:unnamed protein product [Echinostoma caproni]|uniref:C2H2-type domain-containing protein n=1 Tax=Echinostoma caproni TaxID=27848 RepID=A0A183AZ77_9TREM|nr:unnamed protein product [Echinostoma caproni]